MEARDDDNKRPTPKIGGNNGGVDGDDLHARLFDLLTAADERKRLASQPPPAALGSPFRTPVLALRGIGLSRPQSIYPSDSISMIRSRSRTGGTDVDPGEGEVGAAGATYAAYEEETAGRDSEGVTVGPGVDLAATSQPSVSGWAPVRAIVPENMQRHRERLDRLNDETVHNIIGELHRLSESAELAEAEARLERSESKLREAKLRLVREQLLRTNAEQATASRADEARSVKAELATAVRALRKARDEGRRNDEERRRATRAFEEARDRLVKYHEELKVRDARAAGKEEGRTEAWKEAELWLGGSNAPPAPPAQPTLVWAVDPGQKSAAPVYGLVQQVPLPQGSFQQVQQGPMVQPAFQPMPQPPTFQAPQPTQPSVAQEFQAAIQHTPVQHHPAPQQWLPSQNSQQSFQTGVPLAYATPQPYPAPNQQFMPPTAPYTPVPQPIQTARNTPAPNYPPTRPSSARFPPPPSLPPNVPPPAIRLSAPPDTLTPIIAPIPERPIGAAQAYLDDLEHNPRRHELLEQPRTRTPHRRSVSASAAQFTETWPTEPRPPTHARSSSQPENTRLADPDLHPHLHRETSSNLDSRYPLFVPSAPASTHSRQRGSSDPPPGRNSQLNPASFYPLPPSSVGSGVSRAKSARSATRSRMAGALRDNAELDQLHKIEETDEPAFDPRQSLPGAYPASSRQSGRPRSRARPHPSMPSPLRSEVGVGSRPRLSTVHEDEYVQRQAQRAQQQQTDSESSPRLASEAPTILVQPPSTATRTPAGTRAPPSPRSVSRAGSVRASRTPTAFHPSPSRPAPAQPTAETAGRAQTYPIHDDSSLPHPPKIAHSIRSAYSPRSQKPQPPLLFDYAISKPLPPSREGSRAASVVTSATRAVTIETVPDDDQPTWTPPPLVPSRVAGVTGGGSNGNSSGSQQPVPYAAYRAASHAAHAAKALASAANVPLPPSRAPTDVGSGQRGSLPLSTGVPRTARTVDARTVPLPPSRSPSHAPTEYGM